MAVVGTGRGARAAPGEPNRAHPGRFPLRLSTLLVALGVLVAIIPAPASATSPDGRVFADVDRAALYGSAVEVLDGAGVLDGTYCGVDRFCPDGPLRRWVMAVWLVRALDGGDPDTSFGAGFEDVLDRFWWADHVDRLAELGITTGCATGPARFCPYEPVTRGQVAIFLARAFDLDPASFLDQFEGLRSFRSPGVSALVGARITVVCATDQVRSCPSVAKRGEVATYLARAMDLVPSSEYAEEIDGLGIRHLVSSYTTYHDCCAARVTNIQLFADRVDGTVVPPGGRMSLNRTVGRRTRAAGFLPAGTLIRGELVNTVGGGVSQFATTFYNAMFWGGYEDVSHRAHSFYFSRYPEGIEATINWPDVDLVFRNDTAGHVLIGTDYTPTSITVRFYGDNDGRIVVGDWRDGEGRLDVVAEGGPRARAVSAEVSDRFAWRGPPDPLVRGNPALAIDQRKLVQSSRVGWSVRVTRTIDREGRSTIREWTARYLPRREIVEVHPCTLTDTCSAPEQPTDPPEPPPG